MRALLKSLPALQSDYTCFTVLLLFSPWICSPMNCSTPGSSVLHHLPEFAQIHVHWIGDAYLNISSAAPFSFCLASETFPMSQLFASGGQKLEFQLQHQPFQWIFRVDFLLDWLVWSPCCPRHSQESLPTPQFESINSSALNLLCEKKLSLLYMTMKKP